MRRGGGRTGPPKDEGVDVFEMASCEIWGQIEIYDSGITTLPWLKLLSISDIHTHRVMLVPL